MRLEYMANLGFQKQRPHEVCEAVAAVGYQAVGWTRAHFDAERMSRRELVDLIGLPSSFGLATGELVIQLDMVTTDDTLRMKRVEAVIASMEAAAEGESPPPINVFTGPAWWDPAALQVGREIGYAAAWDSVYRAYEPIVRRAEALEVNLALEGVVGMLSHDYFTTCHLIDKFDSPQFGVNYDPSHDVLVGLEDAGWVVRQWARRGKIKHVHLKDAVGVADGRRFAFPLLGEGRVPWAALFDALREVGYGGFMSVESESDTYYKSVMENDHAAVAALAMMQLERLSGGALGPARLAASPT